MSGGISTVIAVYILMQYVWGLFILFLTPSIHMFSLRVWDAGSCMIMNNLSELVVRQLEKDIALKVGADEMRRCERAEGGDAVPVQSFFRLLLRPTDSSLP